MGVGAVILFGSVWRYYHHIIPDDIKHSVAHGMHHFTHVPVVDGNSADLQVHELTGRHIPARFYNHCPFPITLWAIHNNKGDTDPDAERVKNLQ
jgi:hypothetical protein